MTRLLIGLLLTACMAHPCRAERPNVIIVMSDDQGYGDFSCHGNPVLKTPNFDKLHAESVRLTDFHVAPMCTPTRGQLMTGMDALRNGASSVSAGRSMVRRGIPLMPEYFAASGYRTGLFGKWHLGDCYPNLPHHRGFHDAVYHLGWGITAMADTWCNDCFDIRAFANGKLQKYPGYCTDVWFDLAMQWMKERQAKKEPFFCYIPTNAPHAPFWVPAKYKQPYQGKGPAAFFGMVGNLDENMGRLDAFLSEQGLRDNTILIFLHDNGGTAGVQTFNAGMRGRKVTYYEGGHRAACFIRWPAGSAKLGPARDVDALTQVQDLLPTLIDWCALTPPLAKGGPLTPPLAKGEQGGSRAEGRKLDGHSLARLLGGSSDAQFTSREIIVQYAESPGGGKFEKHHACVLWNESGRHAPSGAASRSEATTKRWRLVYGKELYELDSDPGQKTDLADKHSQVVKRLREHYEKWWAEVGPLAENFEPVSIGADQENPVTLTAADWAKVYCDNMNDLRTGASRNGPWHLLVEKDGRYTFELRRWPKAADAAISAGVPAFQAVDGRLPEGKALPITHARFKIAEVDETKPVPPNDKSVSFIVTLRAGTKLPMNAWFLDAAGKELCGAYFVEVKRE
jgi:arylsulfatase